MNENFVRMIFTEAKPDDFIKTFAGAVAHTIDSHLNEDENGIVFESYQTNEGHSVYEVALKKHLDDATAEGNGAYCKRTVERRSQTVPTWQS